MVERLLQSNRRTHADVWRNAADDGVPQWQCPRREDALARRADINAEARGQGQTALMGGRGPPTS